MKTKLHTNTQVGVTSYLELYALPPDTNNISGIRRIGGPNQDYPDFTSAIADLDGRHMMDDLVYIVHDGVYQEQINLGAAINYTKREPSLGIFFKADEAPNTVVSVVHPNGPLTIVGKSDIHFIGIDFQTTSPGGTACTINNSSDIGLHGLEISSTTTAQTACSVANTTGLTMTDVKMTGYISGFKCVGGAEAEFNLLDIQARDLAVDIDSTANLKLNSSKLSVLGAPTAAKLRHLQGACEFSGNTVNSRVFLAENNATLSATGNQITSSQGYALDLTANLGAINLDGGTYQGNGSGAIRINCNSPNDPDCIAQTNTTTPRSISIFGTKIISAGKGIFAQGLPATTLHIQRNDLHQASVGIHLQGIAQTQNTVRIHSNLILADEEGIHIQNSTVPTTVRLNTIRGRFPVPGTGNPNSSGTIWVNGSDNIEFCGNIAVNEAGGPVIQFSSAPAGITTFNNDWYNGTNAVSNNPILIPGSTDVTVNPKFVGQGDYHLSYRSPMLDRAIPCLDSTMSIDNDLEFRNLQEADAGALETRKDAWSGLDIAFVLEDGVAFTAGGNSAFTQFRIDGLTNYGAVNLVMTDQSGAIVYQSTSKTTFWDGRNQSNQQFVPEGAYQYALTVDNRQLNGFVYVKR